MDNWLANNFRTLNYTMVRRSFRNLSMHWDMKINSWEVIFDEVYQNLGSKPLWTFDNEPSCLDWLLVPLFSGLYKLTNLLIFEAEETAMTDKCDLFHFAGHRVSPDKTCPGGNSGPLLCRHPRREDLVHHFLHRASVGLGWIWQSLFLQFWGQIPLLGANKKYTYILLQMHKDSM